MLIATHYSTKKIFDILYCYADIKHPSTGYLLICFITFMNQQIFKIEFWYNICKVCWHGNTYRTTHHGVSFTRSCLTICKHAGIVTFVRCFQYILSEVCKYLQIKFKIRIEFPSHLIVNHSLPLSDWAPLKLTMYMAPFKIEAWGSGQKAPWKLI